MAWKIEKNEGRGQDLVISGWENGIAQSAFLGHEQIINCDVWSLPGLAQPGGSTTPGTLDGGAFSALMTWIDYDPVNAKWYALFDDGTVAVSSSLPVFTTVAGNTKTNASGNGLAVWVSQNDPTKVFVFVARDSNLDVYNIATTTWTNGWQSLRSETEFHPMYVATDAKLYVGNGELVASFAEVSASTFVPGTPATYTWNSSALDLPQQFHVRSLTQLGGNLMIGTAAAEGFNNVPNYAEIFPWDRVSDSFSFPVSLKTNGVNQLETFNNVSYVVAGTSGRVFATNGVTTQPLIQFRNVDASNSNNTSGQMKFRPGAIDVLDGEEILIGLGLNYTVLQGTAGVYSIKDGKYILKNTNLTELTEADIGTVFATGTGNYIYSFRDSSGNYGVRYVTPSERYNDYSPTIVTDIIPVSTFLYKRDFSEIEFRLAQKLATNCGIKISYRTSLYESWTLIGGWENDSTPSTGCTNIGSRMSYNYPASIINAENIQFKIQLRASGTTGVSTYLKEIRVR